MAAITKVLARSVRIPLENPVAISNRQIAGRFYTLVRVECDDGSHGIGFCHGGTRTGDLSATAIRQLLAPHLIGQDPHRTEGLWQELYQDSLLPGRTGAVIRALSAVDNALWDRNAHAAGLPLYRYLGAYRTDSVPAYASGGYYNRSGTPEGVMEEITTYVKAGFKAAKIKIGGAAPASTLWSAARRDSNGSASRLRSPRARRSQNTIDAGISRERSSMRDAAGWMRCWSASKSSASPRATTTSPSRTARAGSAFASGPRSSGK